MTRMKRTTQGTLRVVAVSMALWWGLACEGVDQTPPLPPQNVSSVTGDGVVFLYWDPSPSTDVEGYLVLRNTAEYGTFQEVGYTETLAFADDNVVNGVTYYYAVVAVDHAGNQSEPSEPVIHDTPRPEGYNVVLWSRYRYPEASGFDFNTASVVPYTSSDCDFYLEGTQGDLYLVVPPRALILDFGPIPNMDVIDQAPLDGWDDDGRVPVVPGHGYVLYTQDHHFAKVWVVEQGDDALVFHWAWQVDPNNRELRLPSHRIGGGEQQ